MQIKRLSEIAQAEAAHLLARSSGRTSEMRDYVAKIMEDVRLHGDEAVRRYTKEFDKVELGDLQVSAEEIKAAYGKVEPALIDSLRAAMVNIEKFHGSQIHEEPEVQVSAGIKIWRVLRPIERVGLYIPGGKKYTLLLYS